jgi:TonB family protein
VLIPLILFGGTTLRLIWIAFGLVRLRRFRREGEVMALTTDEHALQEALGARAEIRQVAGLRQPVTFGVMSPVVLLPSAIGCCPVDVRRAVVCHELLHVRRRDWAWLVGEETIRAVLWFHPAIWWLITQIQVAREEVVDELAVATTGSRRAYIAALLAFSDRSAFAPAMPFGQRHRLFQRITLISKESVMSRNKLVLSCATIALVVITLSRFAVAAFPLQQRAIGPHEQQAVAITPENPVPRRVYAVAPMYPQSLVQSGLQAFVTAQVVLDGSGRVVETRRVYAGISRVSGYSQPQPSLADGYAADMFWSVVVDALQRWQYDAPSLVPIAFPVSFRFSPDRDGIELNATPSPFTPAPLWHAGAVSVGSDGIAPPERVKDVPPVYPLDAQDAKVQGMVIVEIRIEPDGRVGNARVMRSIPQLDQAALEAVSQWEFARPLDREGRPTPVITTVTIRFTLS